MSVSKEEASMNASFPVYDREVIGRGTHWEEGRIYGRFRECILDSAYQPIFSIAHKRIVGYEALVRARDVQKARVSPDDLFRQAENLSEVIFLDRLCRYIHVANFQDHDSSANWLFLNVASATVTHGQCYGAFFSSLLETYALPSYRVVIEIVEHPFTEEENSHLMDTIAYYRSLGCLIAIDDFGAGQSNFDRIWLLKPDIVKLDRSMMLRAVDSDDIRQLLPGIVSLLHQAGSLVIMEGIETEAQALIAMESDADMVQGYFFARPDQDLRLLSKALPPFDDLFNTYKISEAGRAQAFLETYSLYHSAFQEAVKMVQAGRSIAEASLPLFRNDTIIRCYLLDPKGLQIGHTVTSKAHAVKSDLRFIPLDDARSADWFRRPYLRRAIMHPGQLQVTRPYLSITGAHMCSTLSMMVDSPSGEVILCCDIKITDRDKS